jgi:hypothetical protein
LNISWNEWTQSTPAVTASYANGFIANWAVSAVAMTQATPASEPGFINSTNKLSGIVIGTAGSFGNSGNTIARAFDQNLTTFFDAPAVSGAWVGLDFGVGVSNVIGQINYWPRAGYSQRMLGGIFQGDNNSTFSDPVTLFIIATAPPEGGIVTSQTIANTNAFRFVRYVGPANGSCNVAELEFFAPNPSAQAIYITNNWNGVQLTLSWPNGGALLEAASVAGPWTTNMTASSPCSIAPTNSQMFFKVLSN